MVLQCQSKNQHGTHFNDSEVFSPRSAVMIQNDKVPSSHRELHSLLLKQGKKWHMHIQVITSENSLDLNLSFTEV